MTLLFGKNVPTDLDLDDPDELRASLKKTSRVPLDDARTDAARDPRPPDPGGHPAAGLGDRTAVALAPGRASQGDGSAFAERSRRPWGRSSTATRTVSKSDTR